jgi:CobQ-like glutamine amidotransferase family enzyme
MKIEILYPELCGLFGDTGNMRYLRCCLPEAEFISTALSEEPCFVNETPELVYMGPMTEKGQCLVIDRLKPHTERINELIDRGTCFLFTGNSMEVLGEFIEAGGEKIECLGILKLRAKRDMKNRFNSLFLGKFGDIDIVGFHSRFASTESEEGGFAEVIRGCGTNALAKWEGVRKNNFFGTNLLGPLLVLNPDFTQYLMKLMGAEGSLAFEETARKAYELRLAEFKDLKRHLD